jgi:hypothetical protein
MERGGKIYRETDSVWILLLRCSPTAVEYLTRFPTRYAYAVDSLPLPNPHLQGLLQKAAILFLLPPGGVFST